MASSTFRPEPVRRGVGRAALLTLPVALWSLLMYTPVLREPGAVEHIGALLTAAFMTALFFQMMRTGETYR